MRRSDRKRLRREAHDVVQNLRMLWERLPYHPAAYGLPEDIPPDTKAECDTKGRWHVFLPRLRGSSVSVFVIDEDADNQRIVRKP